MPDGRTPAVRPLAGAAAQERLAEDARRAGGETTRPLSRGRARGSRSGAGPGALAPGGTPAAVNLAARWGRIARDTAHRVVRHECFDTAKSAAYSAILLFFPLLLFAVA